MRLAWVVMIGLGELTTQRVRAEPASFAFAGPECRDSQAAFEARLAALVKPEERERLTGRVEVTREGPGFQVRLALELGGRTLGERRFPAPSCKAAAETAAVAAAMAAFSEETPPASASSAEPAKVDSSRAWTLKAEPKPDFSRERGLPARSDVRPQPRVGLLGGVEIGPLPAPALAGVLELGVGVGRRWSFALQGGVSAEQEHAEGAARRSFLRLIAAGARACVAPFAGAWLRFDTCGGARLLWLRGRGDGFDVDRSASLTTAAPLLGVDLSVRAPEFVEWRVELEGSVPLSRQRFLVDGREAARAAALIFAARLGPVVRF